MRNEVITILIIVLSFTALLTGCTDDNKKPKASFSVEPEFLQANTTVFFNSTSSGNGYKITNFSWYVNDNCIGNSQYVTYKFHENGSYIISLSVTNSELASDTYTETVVIGDINSINEKLLGLWQWSGNNQIGNWTFYQNNTLKSVFTGILPTGEYGASFIVSWHYSASETELHFTEPSNELLDSATYTYELLENYTILKVTYDNSTAEWHKINVNG